MGAFPRTGCKRIGGNDFFAYLNERYQQGKLARKQYPHYVQALKDAGDRPAVKNVCMEVFGQLSDKAKCSAENWYIFDQEMGPADPRLNTWWITKRLSTGSGAENSG